MMCCQALASVIFFFFDRHGNSSLMSSVRLRGRREQRKMLGQRCTRLCVDDQRQREQKDRSQKDDGHVPKGEDLSQRCQHRFCRWWIHLHFPLSFVEAIIFIVWSVGCICWRPRPPRPWVRSSTRLTFKLLTFLTILYTFNNIVYRELMDIWLTTGPVGALAFGATSGGGLDKQIVIVLR